MSEPRRGADAVRLRGVEWPEYRGDGAQSRRVMAAAVLALHLLLGWTLLQLESVRQVVRAVAPIVVRLLPLSPPLAPPVTGAPLQAPDLPQRSVPLVPPPLIEVPPLPTATPITLAAVAPVVVPLVGLEAPVMPPRAASAPAVVLPAPVAPSVKRIAPAAVRYRVEPRLTMPLLSKRLHESGIVYLLIVVDARGLLASATVQKSSGFARLDAQALQDIRTARFAPQTENGQPIDWETVAPMSYELD